MSDGEEESGGGAERAFGALRAEVVGVRETLESLAETIKKNRPSDYTETLGSIAKRLEIVWNFMAAIEQHPAIRMTPAEHQRAISGAGEGLMRAALSNLDRATAAAVTERRELAEMIGTLHGKWKQWEWIAWTGIAAFFVGLLISPAIARLLPFGWDGQVAAFIMQADRWNAGSALMQAQNPDAWHALMEDFSLVKSNQTAIAACLDAATKAKKAQRCSIAVTAR